MARTTNTYRGARRNAKFGRRAVGNTWPRLGRGFAYAMEWGTPRSDDPPAREKRQNRRFREFVGPTPSALKKAEQRRTKYMHSKARKRTA